MNGSEAHSGRSTRHQRERRDGRGRLSTIEMLPDDCEEDIAWLEAELNERKMPQTEILRQFNARLADRGIRGISKGTFSRYSVRKAIALRGYAAGNSIMREVFSQIDPGEQSDTLIAATELAKIKLAEMLISGGTDPGTLKEVTLSLNRISTIVAREKQVKRIETQDQADADKREAEKAERDRAASEAAAKIDRAGHEAGLSAESIAAIRKGVLGIGG